MLEKFVNDQVTGMLTEIAWYKATDSYDESQYMAAIDSLTDFAMHGLAADIPKPIYDILVDVGTDLHEFCRRRLHVRFEEIMPSQIARAAELDVRMTAIAEKTNVK